MTTRGAGDEELDGRDETDELIDLSSGGTSGDPAATVPSEQLDLEDGSEADLIAQRQELEGELLHHLVTVDREVAEADALDQALVIGTDELDERRG